MKKLWLIGFIIALLFFGAGWLFYFLQVRASGDSMGMAGIWIVLGTGAAAVVLVLTALIEIVIWIVRRLQ